MKKLFALFLSGTLVLSALSGCSSSSSSTSNPTPATPTPVSADTSAPVSTGEPVYGGTLRGDYNRPVSDNAQERVYLDTQDREPFVPN